MAVRVCIYLPQQLEVVKTFQNKSLSIFQACLIKSITLLLAIIGILVTKMYLAFNSTFKSIIFIIK